MCECIHTACSDSPFKKPTLTTAYFVVRRCHFSFHFLFSVFSLNFYIRFTSDANWAIQNVRFAICTFMYLFTIANEAVWQRKWPNYICKEIDFSSIFVLYFMFHFNEKWIHRCMPLTPFIPFICTINSILNLKWFWSAFNALYKLKN